jgi:hypothetical protein
MGAFKLFTIISSGLLSCSGTVALVGWQQVYYQPTGALIQVQNTNWKPVIKVANDRVFDIKVEAGAVPPPVI